MGVGDNLYSSKHSGVPTLPHERSQSLTLLRVACPQAFLRTPGGEAGRLVGTDTGRGAAVRGDQVSWGQTVVMAAQRCECTENDLTVHFRRVNAVVSELQLS